MNPRPFILSVLGASLAAMGLDDRAVAWLLASQRGVLSRAQVHSCGVTASGLRHRIRHGGRWQRLLSGVYLTASGEPTVEQLQVAAMLYAGPVSLITGPAALCAYKIRVPPTRTVDVLVPISRQRVSCGFVAIHRTSRMPKTATVDGALKFAPPARAVADTVRGLAKLSDARAVVASAVQQRSCSAQDLVLELQEGPVRGSAQLRKVLAEVIEGIRSAPEGDLRDLIRASGLPQPIFNARLLLGEKLLAVADAYWEEAGVIAEVDSREWHLSPEDWEQTMRRHAMLSGVGLIVLHFSPRQLRTEPDRVIRDIAAALRNGRPVSAITAKAAA